VNTVENGHLLVSLTGYSRSSARSVEALEMYGCALCHDFASEDFFIATSWISTDYSISRFLGAVLFPAVRETRWHAGFLFGCNQTWGFVRHRSSSILTMLHIANTSLAARRSNISFAEIGWVLNKPLKSMRARRYRNHARKVEGGNQLLSN
jgi:hypothetical protein